MDEIDRATELVEQGVAAGIDTVRRQLTGPGAKDCADCGAPIPTLRRDAHPSATRCIDC